MEDLRVSVERFCLLAGVEALGEMLAEDAEALRAKRYRRLVGAAITWAATFVVPSGRPPGRAGAATSRPYNIASL